MALGSGLGFRVEGSKVQDKFRVVPRLSERRGAHLNPGCIKTPYYEPPSSGSKRRSPLCLKHCRVALASSPPSQLRQGLVFRVWGLGFRV